MATLHDIKTEIKSVKNIQKISRAMKLVATAKLKQAVDRVNATRPYLEKLRNIIIHLFQVEQVNKIEHPYFKTHDRVDRIALIVVAGDRGMCGSLNSDILKKADEIIAATKAKKIKIELHLIGKKAIDYYWKKDLEIGDTILGLSRKPELKQIHNFVEKIALRYMQNDFQKVQIVFAKFISTLSNVPHHEFVLPTSYEQIKALGKTEEISEDCLIEPDTASIMDKILPHYTDMAFFQYILEAVACEHASRMVAMTAATDKAEEIIDKLSLDYNRARQGVITRQIIEIVSGAEAMETV
ncbi:ATP synthase F1 subunit gamma [Candidatus Riflebacteria bacterium]